MIDLKKKYRTAAGYEVRIYATDGGGIWSVHGAWQSKADGSWNHDTWNTDGVHHEGLPEDRLVEVTEKRVVYVNMYKGLKGHETRAAADLASNGEATSCIRIEYMEGQFDD